MVFIYTFQLFSLFLSALFPAQPIERWLVRTRNSNDTCIPEWRAKYGLEAEGYLFKKLPIDDWYVMEVPGALSSGLRSLSCVSGIYVDQPIDWRDTEPNDPAFINQADMKMIGMPKAWDIT